VNSSWALDITFIETYPNVLTTSVIVRIWVLWDVMLCHSIRSSCGFEDSCHIQILENEQCRDTLLTTLKTWILINTTLKMIDIRCHNIASPHVTWTVQATLCYMHWILLTHPVVHMDQCPYDFHFFSPFKNDHILVRWSQKGTAIIMAETQDFFGEEIHALVCQWNADLSCNGNISNCLFFFA